MLKLAGQGAGTVSEARRALQLKVWTVEQRRIRRFGGWVVFAAVLTALAVVEMRTSWLEARILAATGKQLTFRVAPGPSASVLKPAAGPYDQTAGYTNLGSYQSRLAANGFDVSAQARVPELMQRLRGLSLFPIYREKSQTGLEVLDWRGRPIYARRFPQRIYERFEDVPPVVVNSLLFIENRELLGRHAATSNPAIEWDRLAKAVIDLGVRQVWPGHPVSGGSTLATQLEKVRHSPDGITRSPLEKGRQMASASLRAYLSGADTREARKQIVVDYLNSMPLAALPGYGEVIGLGDGLWAWYEADFDKLNQVLKDCGTGREDPARLKEQALAYRQALSLLLAIRKPSQYLLEDRPGLEFRVDTYLWALSKAGVISPRLRDAALPLRPARRYRFQGAALRDFAGQKAADSIRNELLRLLGVNGNYDLDRLDLTVRSTLDAEAGEAAGALLRSLADPRYAISAGVTGGRLLDPEDLDGVIYSFTLFERTPGANVLRVQVDNLNQPLNINESTKLEMGSTAKLRTLVTYLETVAALHAELSAGGPEQARRGSLPRDRLSRWAQEYLAAASDKSLPAMLEAAMNRTYSASPAEAFFTGGGLHVFENFEPKDNGRVMTVREAFQRSVNLVFIRLMRDLVEHFIFRRPDVSPDLLENEDDPRRQAYLERFADLEGKEFLRRFHAKYEGLSAAAALDRLLEGRAANPRQLAVIYRSIRPEASLEEFSAFLAARSGSARLSTKALGELYREYAPERFNWNDRGYLARVHPLELWLLAYRNRHPESGLAQANAASADERREVYRWLFKRGRKQAQNSRIWTILEADAFQEIHRGWRRAGYPFSTLVPSYATAIGSSGDNPAALAELVGILLNGGVRLPAVKTQQLHFAAGTPFETVLDRRPAHGERVLRAEVAERVKQEMLGVVEHGTARRAWRSVELAGGQVLPVGGKTGTGDNRLRIYGPGGGEIGSKPLNRTAAFVFFIGDRYFGTVMAFVPGERADAYRFTSALPVQVFTRLAAAIRPSLIEGAGS